jgi:GntR family transcriptional regulator
MPTYLYEQIANDLRAKIEDGTHPPGSKLPSRKDLCQTHDCSEAPVIRAMLILQYEGLVVPKPGSGTYVADALPERAGR